MKKLIFLTLMISMALSSRANAQEDSSGIYKTASDFRHGKLSYAINYKTEKHKINGYLLFKSGEIRVIHQGKRYTLLKKDVYGYRSTRGEVFRFAGNDEYRILNPKEKLLLYVYRHPGHSPKEADVYKPKYLFSKDELSAPKALTKANLKNAFASNHQFHDALDAQFKTDQELHVYDSMHKMYKLNWILKNNLK